MIPKFTIYIILVALIIEVCEVRSIPHAPEGTPHPWSAPMSPSGVPYGYLSGQHDP